MHVINWKLKLTCLEHMEAESQSRGSQCCHADPAHDTSPASNLRTALPRDSWVYSRTTETDFLVLELMTLFFVAVVVFKMNLCKLKCKPLQCIWQATYIITIFYTPVLSQFPAIWCLPSYTNFRSSKVFLAVHLQALHDRKFVHLPNTTAISQ